MRPEKLYLTDILEAAEAIRNFCKGVTYVQFEEDDMRRSAVLQKLIVIGEAAGRLSPGFRTFRGWISSHFAILPSMNIS